MHMENWCRLAARCTWRKGAYGFARNYHIPGRKVHSSIFIQRTWDHVFLFQQTSRPYNSAKKNQVGAHRLQPSSAPNLLPSRLDRLFLQCLQPSTLIVHHLLVARNVEHRVAELEFLHLDDSSIILILIAFFSERRTSRSRSRRGSRSPRRRSP